MRSRLLTPLAVLAVLALLPAVAGGATPKPGGDPKLWATINVCDTQSSPDTLGIRGSMPGTANGREQMFMRFQAQYLSADENNTWHNVTQGGDSGFVAVGRATKTRQRGWDFRITPAGASVLLRGMVTFEWRRHGEVVRRAHERTHKGHQSSAGADPAGFSATNCTITK